jgi:hypothetical protein
VMKICMYRASSPGWNMTTSHGERRETRPAS